jgi:ferredoxin
MKVSLEQDKCVGAGQCVLIAPDVFDQRDEDGIAILLQENPPAELQEGARQSAWACPGLAIAVDES